MLIGYSIALWRARNHSIAEPGVALRDGLSRCRGSAPMRYLSQIRRQARREELGTHLLAICGQQLLCTAPIIVLLAAVARQLTGVSAADVLSHMLHLHPAAHRAVVALFADPSRASTTGLIINLIAAVALGTGMAASFQRALERVWHQPAGRLITSALRQLCWSTTVPILCAGMVLLGRVSHAADLRLAVVAGVLGQLTLLFGFLWWTQRLLLAARIGCRRLLPGTILATAALAVTLQCARLWIAGQITDAQHSYGAIGTAIVISTWTATATTATTVSAAVGAWAQRDRETDRPACGN